MALFTRIRICARHETLLNLDASSARLHLPDVQATSSREAQSQTHWPMLLLIWRCAQASGVRSRRIATGCIISFHVPTMLRNCRVSVHVGCRLQVAGCVSSTLRETRRWQEGRDKVSPRYTVYVHLSLCSPVASAIDVHISGTRLLSVPKALTTAVRWRTSGWLPLHSARQ
jgi:hypothetical protein